jgi:outer membrane immunogenic protein
MGRFFNSTLAPFVLAAFLGFAPTTEAGDGSVPFRWSGPYVGAYLNYSWNDLGVSTANPHQTNTAALIYNQTFSADRFGGGGELGYNWQSGPMVFGVALDATYVGVDKTSLHDVVGLDEIYKAQLSWLVTARARLGVAFDRTLVYTTAGLALGDVKVGYQNFDATGMLQNEAFYSEIRPGWVVGLGLEHAFSATIVGRVEYLHTDFGTATVRDIYGPFGEFDGNFKVVTDLLKVGLNFKF